jgi:hypothetical protein
MVKEVTPQGKYFCRPKTSPRSALVALAMNSSSSKRASWHSRLVTRPSRISEMRSMSAPSCRMYCTCAVGGTRSKNDLAGSSLRASKMARSIGLPASRAPGSATKSAVEPVAAVTRWTSRLSALSRVTTAM